MPIRANEGWIRAGLAVLVTGVLGGGVVTVTRDSREPRKVTADGATRPMDLAAAPAAATEDKPKGDPAVGDKVMVGADGGSVTVSAIEDDVSAGRLFGAGKGFKYVAAEVKGCSGPHEKNLSFSPDYFLLRIDDGTMRDHGVGTKKPELDPGTVPAGKCLSGWVTFTVPDGAFATAVLYDGSSRLMWAVPLPKGAHPTTTTTGKPGATTSTTGPSDSSSTPTTAGKTTSTTAGKGTTTTTRAATSAKAGATTTTTARPGTTTTTGKSSATTSTTSKSASSSSTTTTGPAKPGPTTSTTTASKPTTSSTEPAAVSPAPTTPQS